MEFRNKLLRVRLDASTGGFASVYDSRTGYEYIGAPDRALLFRLVAPKGELRGAHIDAAQAAIACDKDAARIDYRLPGATAQATLRLEGDAILARLTVTNTGDTAIEETIFPWVRGVGALPEGALVWPFSFGRRRYDDPFGKDLGGDHRTWNEWTQKVVARYPQHLATAWCDYGNGGQGIALEGRHTDFSIMDFWVHKVVEKTHAPVRRTLDLATVHPRRIDPGETWESPWVRMAVHEGDWHVVADAHREWLETWIRKPDRPKRFAESVGWHFFFMKHQDGSVTYRYEDLPRMAEAALAAACPYILLFGWQAGGHDNHYLYRYVANEDWGGAEALRQGIAQARAMGVEILPFYNGTLANIEMPEHQEFGHRWEVRTREGHPLFAGNWARHNYDAPTRNRDMLHYEICPCPEHRAYFLETVERIVAEYGFGNLQLDQIAEKMFLCHHHGHGHDKPDRAFVDGLGALLPETRRRLRRENPEGVMISEALNDFTGQWCDSSWDWNLLLPFPEPVLYTLPWLLGSHEIDALEYGEVNRAFAYKLHLDMKIGGGDEPITRYPEFADHVKGLAGLRRRVADYYVHADFRDQVGIRPIETAGAEVKVFHNRDAGKVGIVVAELEGEAREVRLENRWRPAAGTVGTDSSTGRAPRLPSPDDALKLRLQPYEVRVVCIDL